MNDLIRKIQQELPQFSKGQKQIAHFLLEHADKAAFLTASKLGSMVGVSESTVVRFATELGYDGYPHLQRTLQSMIRNQLTAVQRMEVSSDRLDGKDVLHTVLHSDMDMLRATLESLSHDTFQQAVDTLMHAKRIYILGVRSSAALADFLGFYLNLLFDHVTLLRTNSIHELLEQILWIGSEDLFFGISFPRYSKRTIHAMRYAGEHGASVLALTDSPASPLAQVANITLFAKSDMASFVDSLVAPLSVINALIVALGMNRKTELEQTFTNLETIWEQYDVYEKPGEETN